MKLALTHEGHKGHEENIRLRNTVCDTNGVPRFARWRTLAGGKAKALVSLEALAFPPASVRPTPAEGRRTPFSFGVFVPFVVFVREGS